MIFIILFFLCPFSSYCDESEVPKGEIVIRISGLRNNNGIIRALLFNTSDGFPANHKNSFALKNVRTENDSVLFVFSDIPYENYAVSVLHDENENGKLDTNWIGLPKEGVGVSNNVKSKFGPPKFEDAKFKLNSKTINLTITINYLSLFKVSENSEN